MGDSKRSRLGRRTLLRAAGAGSVTTLAGCIAGRDESGSEGTGDGDESEQSSVEPRAVDVAESATWLTATLEDATTGEEFSIAEFDRPAIVHTFSIGCAVCRSQHDQFADLVEDGANVAIVDLTIESNETPERVGGYAAEEGFDWRFSIAPETVTRSLADNFGQEVYTSSTSPVVLACPDGATYRLEKVVDAGPLESVLEESC